MPKQEKQMKSSVYEDIGQILERHISRVGPSCLSCTL